MWKTKVKRVSEQKHDVDPNGMQVNKKENWFRKYVEISNKLVLATGLMCNGTCSGKAIWTLGTNPDFTGATLTSDIALVSQT